MLNTNYELFKATVKDKKVAVLGLGISNVPAIEFLKKLGAIVTGCDKREKGAFDKKILNELEHNCVNLKLGENYLDGLSDYDIVLKSPGIRVLTPEIQNAIKDGVTVTSEMELFMSMCPCTMIGITGSDGKTTTTSLVYEMLKTDGYTVHVGGNIGTPLLSKLDEISSDDMVVLELSSFQLQTLSVSPHISVITNLSPNHLDYHKDMEEYVQAKANIFNFHGPNSRLVLNADNEITNSLKENYKYTCDMFSRVNESNSAYLKDGAIWYKGRKLLETDDIKIKGTHNIENYMAAICAVSPLVRDDTIVKVAREFSGVEHRMEFVRQLDGVSFFNDSIGSSPTRTIAGLDAQPPGRIVLIAGGYDKKLPFDKLAEKICQRVSVLVLIGETAIQIKDEVESCPTQKRKVPVMIADDMQHAVKLAFSFAKGLVDESHKSSVILSPACASFDMYKNFEERGKHFKEIVNNI